MTDNIQKLADRARAYAVNKASKDYGANWEINNPVDERVVMQKFAELLADRICQINYGHMESYREACEINDKIREYVGMPTKDGESLDAPVATGVEHGTVDLPGVGPVNASFYPIKGLPCEKN